MVKVTYLRLVSFYNIQLSVIPVFDFTDPSKTILSLVEILREGVEGIELLFYISFWVTYIYCKESSFLMYSLLVIL